jgi:ribonuclease Z
MFQITFLGTSGSIPTVERGLPALAVKYESQLLLWDCGEGTQRQLMRYKAGYGSISAIFITHPHLDHYLGMFGLLETLKLSSVSPKKIPVFFPGAADGFERYAFAAPEKIKKGELYRTNDFTISAFAVKHSKDSYGFIFQENEKVKFHEEKAHSLGLRGSMFREIQQKGSLKTAKGMVKLQDVSWVKPGRKIVYGGDCLPDSNIIEAARGADVLIHEATFDASRKDEAKERMHSTAADAAAVARKAGVKKLILTHISPRYAEVKELLEQARAVFPDTEIAYDGLKIDIK